MTLLRRLAGSERMARGLLIVVVVTSVGFAFETFTSDAPLHQEMLYFLTGGALAYGALAHVLCHYGCVRRFRRPDVVKAAPDEVRRIPFGALIPSYREEPEFVYRAMLSVALQRSERKWIRLLVDDPPQPSTSDERRLLEASRALPDRVTLFLEPLHKIVSRAEASVVGNPAQAPQALATAHRHLSMRFTRLARDWSAATPEDRFFRTTVLAQLAIDHANEADRVPKDASVALSELSRLRARFVCDIRTFERKAFSNLSHAANKAMNLNTGIDLMGKRLQSARVGHETHLVERSLGEVLFPEVEFLITLDADSVLAPSYTETLLGIASADNAADVAVVQTPYAALSEPMSAVERVAGATTDVQRLMHQGFGYFNAAFWVGANAVLRVHALRDIAVTDTERGFPIRRYIQDRTPIEDTESTLDLGIKGWRVLNHNAIQAWSATPPDFGALVIQRRRWACGGLIVLPKAFRAAAATSPSMMSALLQLLVRSHYLGSLFWCPAALVVLLAAPFEPSLAGVFLPLIALPYFMAYLFGLILSRRPAFDLVRAYGLNLLLIPINLTGAIASLRQAATGAKVPFARTPKINDRTASPVLMLVVIWGGTLFLLMGSVFDTLEGNIAHALFSGMNGVASLVAALIYIGWRETREDLQARLADVRLSNLRPIERVRLGRAWFRRRPTPILAGGEVLRLRASSSEIRVQGSPTDIAR